jgi:hypothetical protein
MRQAVRPLALAASALLVAGLLWAYVDRDAESASGPVVLLLLGVLAGLAAAAAWVVLERRPAGLVVPEGPALPSPWWWGPVGAIGAVAAIGGAVVSVAVLVIGVVLLVAAVVGFVREVQASEALLDRRAVRAARAIRSFAVQHAAGGEVSAEGTVAHIGRGATKVSVVGADGHWGDQVVAGYERARLAASMAGMTVHDEWPRELIGRVRTGRYEWSRMAGIQVGGGRAD